MKRATLALLVALCVGGAASTPLAGAIPKHPTTPDTRLPPATLTLNPTAEWMDTGIRVHKGERLVFAAIGEVHWQALGRTTGPDGDGGVPGWSVGPGGLRARVGPSGHPFDLGARTHALTAPKHARPPHDPYVPPPVNMPRDGSLYLGFKQFTPGANTGQFEVTIKEADSPDFHP